jgi:glutamate--cysteine ligase
VLTEADLLADVSQRLFSPSSSGFPHAVGVELELIPVDVATHERTPAGDRSAGSTAILSRLGKRKAWDEQSAGEDPPSWIVRDGSRISFEPGGQIEISSAPLATASEVIDAVQSLGGLIEEQMRAAGIDLIAKGVDPYNEISAVPLQLRRERYTRMTDYFNSVGPSGIQMMRQTAALQISVERGSDPLPRWRLLNALAPVVVGLFANSRRYAGADTDFASYRAHFWRTLDSSRTGIPYASSDPARHYLEFALDAIAMKSGSSGRGYSSFRDLLRTGEITVEDWQFHLSTLFPEVRPREYFELRSADTIELEWLPAPIVFVTGLVYDASTAVEAARIIGEPSSSLLERAGRLGLGDPEIRRLTATLSELSLSGARFLGDKYLRHEHVETARAYFARALDGT